MTVDRWRALGFGSAMHVLRLGVIIGTLAVAPLLGITGWCLGSPPTSRVYSSPSYS